jgi:uncharacterized membrane protein
MDAYLLDWANLLVRWLHLIAGVAWIGSSFYFVWLDNHLTAPARPGDTARGVHGELWSVHGGGFYHSQKYLTGPRDEPLTENLHWFKWEAYTTWLSGMGLLAVVYWFGASTYLIDRSVMPLSVPVAIALSIAVIVGGWLVYNTLCRLLKDQDTLLAALLFVFVVAVAWGLSQVFSARAAYLHVGAMLGTLMVANVAMIIIPGQRRMLAQIRAGQTPDPEPGRQGKLRSSHNTYFTLPVLFIMISNHYPFTYSHRHGWLVLAVIMLAGVLIRQFFVLRHKGIVKPWLPAVAVLLLVGLAAAIAPPARAPAPSAATAPAAGATTAPAAVAAASADLGIEAIMARRCVSCHAAQPTQAGFAQAPKGVMLETAEQRLQHAAKIAETVASRYMPIGNLTGMTDAERAAVADWHAKLPR